MSTSESGAYRRPEKGGSIWRLPEESDPRPLTVARQLLRLEAYVVPAGGGLLLGLALAGAGRSPIEDWTLSGMALLLWFVLVGAAVAFWVAVSIKVGKRVWAYSVALALQGGLILAAAAVICTSLWGPNGQLHSVQQGGVPASGLPGLLLPLVPLFAVPCAALILLLHPASRAAALPAGTSSPPGPATSRESPLGGGSPPASSAGLSGGEIPPSLAGNCDLHGVSRCGGRSAHTAIFKGKP